MTANDRPMPQTEGHPLWPAFKAWAADHLPNLMLAAYWECWKAAYLAGLGHGANDPSAIKEL